MVYRIFVEKKKEVQHEAQGLFYDIRSFLGISSLEGVRVINRYDVENITPELFEYACRTVFSEPQTDIISESVDTAHCAAFAVEYLPGQFDMRAESAEQCIQIISQGARPTVRTAKIYLLEGMLSEEDTEKIKKYIINPVECREASWEKPETLTVKSAEPQMVETLEGFTSLDDEGLSDFIREKGLAMDEGDLRFCRDYFCDEGRDPTITEIRLIDTYWSDHCRHTTFLTTIDEITFEDKELEAAWEEYLKIRRAIGRTKPQNLMDIATVAAKYLKEKGKLPLLDESEEINACTVKINVKT